ncbi:hypothetical protein HanPI659440_Chr07g0255841 [Helianthus annuus]|nr:hypothetical protein HanPI659440_Chr07g0255841 [Helianthus annuus]
MVSRKRIKSSGEGASSASSLRVVKWQQISSILEVDDRLFMQDWQWVNHKNNKAGEKLEDEKKKHLSQFRNKQLEIRLWKYKMALVTNGVAEVCVYERLVNVEKFRQIGTTQKFERLGWERVLDWRADNTQRIYLTAMTEWLASLRFENQNGHASTWRLVGDTGRRTMVMTFETINQIANFDTLGVNGYYYDKDLFWKKNIIGADPDNLLSLTLPNYQGGQYDRRHLSLEENPSKYFIGECDG